VRFVTGVSVLEMSPPLGVFQAFQAFQVFQAFQAFQVLLSQIKMPIPKQA
jgi:hypothetical protein